MTTTEALPEVDLGALFSADAVTIHLFCPWCFPPGATGIVALCGYRVCVVRPDSDKVTCEDCAEVEWEPCARCGK